MKRLFIVLLTILLTLSVSGCADETVLDQQILMIEVRENEAWGRYQSVTVIDRSGNRFSQSVGVDDCAAEKPDGWVELSEDGWYERLVEIAESGKPADSVSTRNLNLIRQNVRNFRKWTDFPIKEYSNLKMADYGQISLYGVYFDSGEPRLTWLATYGDVQKCVNSSEVRKFVNKLCLFDYRYT